MTASEGNPHAALLSRSIPTMTFSNSSSPLTKPVAPIQSTNSRVHAAERFAVHGGAVLTGGAGELALVSARALLQHGLSALTLFDLAPSLEASAKAINSLRRDFPDALVEEAEVDVTSAEAVDKAFAEASSRMGGIQTLCCFAGIVKCIPSLDIIVVEFGRVVDVNLTGSFLCAQAAARHMKESRVGGSILLTASISAHHTNYPQPQSAYNVSKAAIAHLGRNLAAEWAVHGIRVNSISPGYMDTILNAGDGLKDIREIWNANCPMGRMGDAEELTGAVVLLCAQRAGRYITGVDILVDGRSMSL